MEMNFTTLLQDEIVDEFNKLGGIEAGTDEYKTTVDGLTKLIDRAIEIEKIDIDNKDKIAKRAEAKVMANIEQEFRRKQLNDEQMDRIVRNCIAVAGIVIPSVITIWGTIRSFEFEKEGTITTMMGRGFINKLLPKGK